MLRRHDPIPEEQMEYESPKNTICETLRQIYHATDNAEVRHLSRVATSMAKSMNNRLVEKYGKKFMVAYWDGKHKAKPIDVLFLAKSDWCNTGYKFWRLATEHLNLNCVMFKGALNPMQPPEEAPLHPSLTSVPLSAAPTTVMCPGLETLIHSSRVVHTFASMYPLCAVDWEHVNLVVQHGGSVYRQHPESCNKVFNPISNKVIVQTPDLLGLGADDESLIYFTVDTDNIVADFSPKRDGKVLVGHLPSNPTVKGTDLILDTFKSIDDPSFRWGCVTDRVPWEEQIKLYRKFDVIVEACAPMQGSRIYGEFGNTALEAAASGCIVITHHTHGDIYEKEYGELAPLVANDKETLRKRLNTVLNMTNEDRVALKRKMRNWAVNNHGMRVTAARLWDKVYRYFF